MMVPSIALTVLLMTQGDFPICQESNVQATPEVLFADSLFYVFWTDFRYSSVDTYAIYGARVTTGGAVLDLDGKEVYANKAETRPAAAYDGNNLLVVLQDSC
ncbi:MAG: hypothetical protein WBE28_11905 [bacterium]